MVKTGEKRKAAAAKAKNPSPDTVTCIDLTGSGNDTHDFFRPRLGSVRKELQPPSAKKRGRGGLKTTGLDAPGSQEIIVIDSDSDEDVPMAASNTAAAAASRPSVASASRPAKKAKSKSSGDSPLKPVKKEGRKKVKVDGTVAGKVDSEGVEIVEATAPVLTAATMVSEQAKNTTTDDDDIVVEGVLNETRLPHMRQHCTRCPFNLLSVTSSRRQTNSTSCDLCYCYVCDCPVKDCKNWYSATSTSPEHNHCCASDKMGSWGRMRSRAKNQSSNSNSSPDGSSDEDNYGYVEPAEPPPTEDQVQRFMSNLFRMRAQRERTRNPTYGLPGPFKPDNADAAQNDALTKCRHCSWFVTLTTWRRSRASSADWCKVCGRVALEKDLEKQQVAPDDDTSNNASAPNESYCIGEKVISFRIKAHDPRLFDEYKANWEEHSSGDSGWQYDQADRDEEVFLHRIGRAPTFSNIVGMIPCFGNENVPDEFEILPRYIESGAVRDAADAIIIEDPRELQFVVGISSLFRAVDGSSTRAMKVAASWDKTSRTGNLKFRFELPKNSFIGHGFTRHWTPLPNERIMTVLGLWCGLFPLQPSELCIRFNGSSSEEIINRMKENNHDVIVGHHRVKKDHAIDALREKLPSRVDSLLTAKDAFESRLTMTPSDGSRFGGGVCIRDPSNSFGNSLVRFFSEQFPSMIQNCYRVENEVFASNLGANRRDTSSCFDAVLGYETATTAQACFKEDAYEYESLRDPSIKDIMVQIENLGHESEDCVEGLKVELLEFDSH